MPSRFLFPRQLARSYFVCGPSSPDWPAPVDRDPVRRWRFDPFGSDSSGGTEVPLPDETLFAGGRQLLQLSLLVGNEPARHDCCELVPEHLRLRQESLDLGFLAGVELLADHEGQVLLDGAKRLVGGREADVRRLWRSVAVGRGSGGFGHGFPYRTSFCDLPEDFRCWLDWT